MSKIEVNEIDAQSGSTITVGSACKSVAVPGNVVKTNAIQASDAGNIISQSGTTITLGASGDTINLASGASQSGFGRTGTVDWQTTPKTGNFTAANGEGYFVNTTSGAVTMTMPSGSAGAIVAIQDYNKTFDSNNLTITPASGEKINGGTADGDLIINTEGQGLTFIYVDATVGWKTVHENEFTSGGSSFITATGGTITTSGNCKIHTFTGPGTFQITAAGGPTNNKLAYMVVAGGGGSGGNRYHIQGGGGGGGGGFREGRCNPFTPYTASPLVTTGITATVASFPIAVGAAGSGGGGGGGNPNVPDGPAASSGSVSTFSTITSAGGGAGAQPANAGTGPALGTAGGSGGGGGGGSPQRAGGTGNTPPTSPAQGQNGGPGSNANQTLGGSGGGATTAGVTSPGCSPPPAVGSGGDGATTSISASPVTYSAGGDYSHYNPGGFNPVGPQPANSGNGGGAQNAAPGPHAPANSSNYSGNNGGTGIVIIRYKFQ